MGGCGPPQQGTELKDIGTTTRTVIQGTVTVDGEPVSSAYVRLLDSSGEFAGEVAASATGQFRFFAAPGQWTLRALSRRGIGQMSVTAGTGVTDAVLALDT